MTHSYYNGNGAEYDPYYRSNHRNMSHAVYYDRLGPYAYHEPMPRHDNRSEYPGRPVMRTMIHEPDDTASGEQRSRKRISVACRRCRKRKIKCSGDLGDGLGCSACRHAGADGAQCAFIRVGAKECSEVPFLPGVEITAMSSAVTAPPITSSGGIEVPPNTPGSAPSSAGYGSSHLSHRPSLPTLHTRATYPDLESHYQHSPLDGYGYASAPFPRQDSFASTYGLENYRSWSTTAPAQAPATATYYEPVPSYSFGSLQAPSFPQAQHHPTRLPSVTTETFSPFHMSHLNSSLPVHTAYERRLPIPPTYTLQYPQPQQAMPQIRPLGSYTEPRVHINGIYSRNAMPWSIDSVSGGRTSSISSYAPPSGLPMSSVQSTTASSEPVLGYQFSLPAQNTGSSSPEPSPTSGTAVADSFSSSSSTTSIPPAPTYRYPPISSAGYSLPGVITEDHTNAGSCAPPSLFSFSTESSGRRMPDDEETNNDENTIARSESSYSTIPQPQLNHAASADTFQRSSSHEQSRASAVHRMSLSNLNTNY